MQPISQDLKDALLGISGLSPTNLYYCKKWFLTYYQEFINLQQPVVKIQETYIGKTEMLFDSKNQGVQQIATELSCGHSVPFSKLARFAPSLLISSASHAAPHP